MSEEKKEEEEKVKCPYCDVEVPKSEIPAHLGSHSFVSCPWGCPERILKEKYGEHLMEKHYKKEGDKVMGPFPAGFEA